jgi:hypothetical protein
MRACPFRSSSTLPLDACRSLPSRVSAIVEARFGNRRIIAA